MTEEQNAWGTVGYAAMLSSIFVGLMKIASALGNHDFRVFAAEYALFGVISSLPAVILVNRVRDFAKLPGRTSGKTYVEDIRPGEYIIMDARPNRVYFVKLYLSALLNLVLIMYLLSSTEPIVPRNLEGYVNFLVISLTLTTLIYILSVNAVRANRYVALYEKIWVVSFAVIWSFVLIYMMKDIFERTYPVSLWERILGIPSIGMILFGVILFVLSSIFWRMEMMLSSRDKGPMSAISIVMMAGGIASLFPPAWIIFSPRVIQSAFWAFLVSSAGLVVFMTMFLLHRGGMEFMVTTQRIISTRNFLIKDVKEYPYDSILSVEVVQGILGRRYGYGDLRIRARRNGMTITLTLHGINDPELAKNTILCLSTRSLIESAERMYRGTKSERVHPSIQHRASINLY